MSNDTPRFVPLICMSVCVRVCVCVCALARVNHPLSGVLKALCAAIVDSLIPNIFLSPKCFISSNSLCGLGDTGCAARRCALLRHVDYVRNNIVDAIKQIFLCVDGRVCLDIG